MELRLYYTVCLSVCLSLSLSLSLSLCPRNEYSLREDSSLDEFQDLRKVADSAVPIEEDGLGEEMEGVKVQGSRGVKTKGVVSGHGHISSKKLTQ